MFRTDACCCFSFSQELEALRLQLLYPPVSKGRSALASALRSFVLLLGLKLRTTMMHSNSDFELTSKIYVVGAKVGVKKK